MAHLIDGSNREFAERIRNLRKEKGKTQEELAQYCEISVRNISLYESGHSLPRSKTLEKLGECLDCDPYFLLKGRSREITENSAIKRKKFQDCRIKKNQMLYIYDWENLFQRHKMKRGQLYYSENPTRNIETSDLSLFVPYIAPRCDYVAVRVPYNLSLSNSEFSKDYEQILIINFGKTALVDLKDGLQILYASLDKSKAPVLGTVRREIGEENFFIESIPNKFKHLEFLDTEYEILGVVEAVILKLI